MSRMTLEPVPLGALAEFMADQEWVDMAVLNLGLLDRVQIETLHIHRSCEELTVRQEWCEVSADETKVERYTFSQDRVRRCHPTSVTDIREVRPVNQEPPAPREFTTDEEIARVWEAVADAAEFMFGVKRSVFTKKSGQGGGWTDERRNARDCSMLAMYEWTPLSQSRIASTYFDGRSQAAVSYALRSQRGQMDPFRKLVTIRLGSGPPKIYA
jgi:hypothetical protein